MTTIEQEEKRFEELQTRLANIFGIEDYDIEINWAGTSIHLYINLPFFENESSALKNLNDRLEAALNGKVESCKIK